MPTTASEEELIATTGRGGNRPPEQPTLQADGLPARFELEQQLGQGGGGQVWAARDRASGQRVALKVLHLSGAATEAEALVREATALSGLEGLGFPRVLRLGRTVDGRLYLVRELVEGVSLEVVLEEEPSRYVGLVCQVADALTVVHRAGLLHGDVKPANVIVRPDGAVTLVDLGLALAFREGGEMTRGLTPHYAAPEVHAGQPVTASSEVFSLGVMLRDFLEEHPDIIASTRMVELEAVVERALSAEPAERFPSTDELAEALRSALAGDVVSAERTILPWPLVDVDTEAFRLDRAVADLEDGQRLDVVGPVGAGVSTLLRRLAWTVAVEGRPVGYVDEELSASRLLEEELEGGCRPGALLIIDSQEAALDPGIDRALEAGARVVCATERPEVERIHEVRPLPVSSVRRLLQTVCPSFPENLVEPLVERTHGRPGALRAFVEAARERPLAAPADLDEILTGATLTTNDPEQAVVLALERGNFALAKEQLDRLGEATPLECWLRARYELAAGSAERARELSERAQQSSAPGLTRQKMTATLARALLGLGRYPDALRVLESAEEFEAEARAEALSYRGLGQSLLGEHEAAASTLQAAVASTESTPARFRALAQSSLATAQWRAGKTVEAIASYRAAAEAATEAGDAGVLSSTLINLAGLLKQKGELAESMKVLESAVDASRRSGRKASLQQALLNLSNADLYLGRLERARAQLARVGDPDDLVPALRAQLHGLRAELAARLGRLEEAMGEYQACETSWAELGRKGDAGEAALEAVLAAAAVRSEGRHSGSASFIPTLERLEADLQRGAGLSGKENALYELAAARVEAVRGAPEAAEEHAKAAQILARQQDQKEWLWRAAALEAELAAEAGKRTRASRAREEAIEVLEEIGARLPADLREVFWNDPRRAELRGELTGAPSTRAPMASGAFGDDGLSALASSGSDAVSRMSQTPLERRLAKILAINSDLAGEIDPTRLAEKIVAHATELLRAERGFLLLGSTADELVVYARRGGQGAQHEHFSRSIAGQVLETGKALVSIDAERDQRLAAFESVHLSLVTAVACVPILSPTGGPVGALYLETRSGTRPDFGNELPTLQAFADQAAIALENARLVRALEQKTHQLSRQNEKLLEARSRLKEALGRRTERLREVRRELRETRSQIQSHTSYAGLVGGSPAMRRIYSLIERVKDTDVPVLITGESGTGKEVVARAIHQGSVRSKRKMLAVNCGAIPEPILESELFGHVRGAFTGADRSRGGLFREADGGVLFLDEIGETPLKMQAGLLRVLQEAKVRPVGGSEEIDVNVRVIFATNRDLDVAVERREFREDLLYRIRVVELALPPLRERREDIPLLVDHFLDRFAARFGQEKKSLSREALARVMEHPLPGNVRQLENTLLNAWVLSEATKIDASDIELPEVRPSQLPPTQGRSAEAIGQHASPPGVAAGSPKEKRARRKGTLSEHQRGERAEIVEALEAMGWNRVKAAETLGMPRRTFYRRLKEYGLQ